MAQHQRFATNGPIDIGVGIEVANRQRLAAQCLDRRLHAQRRPGIAFTISHLGQDVLQDEFGQILVRAATRLAQRKQHRQQNIPGMRHAVGQDAVSIERHFGFGEQLADFLLRGAFCRMLLVKLQQLCHIVVARINLRLEEEHRIGDHLGLASGQQIGHFGQPVTRPGPAPEIGDRGVVNRHHGHAIQRRPARRLHAHIVSLAFQAADQIAAPGCEHRNADHHAKKPISLQNPVLRIFPPAAASVISH